MGLRDLNAERVLGTPRTGVAAALIPDSGEHGPALAYAALLPEYAGKEVRVKITRRPSGGDLWVDEDSSFIYDGPSDSLEYVVLVNAAPTGETWLSALTVGAVSVIGADSATPNTASEVTVGQAHNVVAADCASVNASEIVTISVGTSQFVLMDNCLTENVLDSVDVVSNPPVAWVLAADVESTNTCDGAVVGQSHWVITLDCTITNRSVAEVIFIAPSRPLMARVQATALSVRLQ